MGHTRRREVPEGLLDHVHAVLPVRVLLLPAGAGTGLVGGDRGGRGGIPHQRVDRVGVGLTVTARAAADTVEGLELPGHQGWFVAVRWRPEDTAHDDAAQRGLFGVLVRAVAAARLPTPVREIEKATVQGEAVPRAHPLARAAGGRPHGFGDRRVRRYREGGTGPVSSLSQPPCRRRRPGRRGVVRARAADRRGLGCGDGGGMSMSLMLLHRGDSATPWPQ
ncbi:gamma-glutamyl-gamma-aminobutyrate hydrolase family protein [Streptomyces violascens]|uniref:gamma-glutamyl-gamma-aminobutyrate hydrolase family protein n=1 Tax=Streptomyces violascens TaxID=67381 RepID=UPI00365470C3